MNTQFNQKRAIAQACKQNVAYLRNQAKAANDHDRQKQADIELRMDLENTQAALSESLDWYPGAAKNAVKWNYIGREICAMEWGDYPDINRGFAAGVSAVIAAIIMLAVGLHAHYHELWHVSWWAYPTIISAPIAIVYTGLWIQNWHNARVDKRRQAYNKAMELDRSEWDVMEDEG